MRDPGRIQAIRCCSWGFSDCEHVGVPGRGQRVESCYHAPHQQVRPSPLSQQSFKSNFLPPRIKVYAICLADSHPAFFELGALSLDHLMPDNEKGWTIYAMHTDSLVLRTEHENTVVWNFVSGRYVVWPLPPAGDYFWVKTVVSIFI